MILQTAFGPGSELIQRSGMKNYSKVTKIKPVGLNMPPESATTALDFIDYLTNVILLDFYYIEI